MPKHIQERLDRIEGLLGNLQKASSKPFDLAAAAEYLHISNHIYIS